MRVVYVHLRMCVRVVCMHLRMCVQVILVVSPKTMQHRIRVSVGLDPALESVREAHRSGDKGECVGVSE